MNRVLIIGNGPSALEAELGEVIDSDKFDAVIRINRGHKLDDGSDAISKYKKYVGSKCDFWIASDLRVELAMQRHSEYKGIFIVTPKFKFDRNLANTVTAKYNNIHFIPPPYEDDINSIVDFSPKWPSTGVVAIHFAINHFKEVYIYGFDTYDTKYDHLHFFEDKPNKYKNKEGIDHSPKKEKDYLQHLIDKNLIKILI